jgi:hypothetical protein
VAEGTTVATPETTFMRQSKGPRKFVTARVSAQTVLALEAAAAAAGLTRSELVALVLEGWVEEQSADGG